MRRPTNRRPHDRMYRPLLRPNRYNLHRKTVRISVRCNPISTTGRTRRRISHHRQGPMRSHLPRLLRPETSRSPGRHLRHSSRHHSNTGRHLRHSSESNRKRSLRPRRLQTGRISPRRIRRTRRSHKTKQIRCLWAAADRTQRPFSLRDDFPIW